MPRNNDLYGDLLTRPRHYFHRKTAWRLRMFADEMRERMRTIYERTPEVENDFLDQAEDAERLFAGVPTNWGNEWGDVDDDAPPYAGDLEL